MRNEELERACPRIGALMAAARLDISEGRYPLASSAAMLAILSRAAAALGLHSLDQIPAGQLRELTERGGDGSFLEEHSISDAALQGIHEQLAALNGQELLALLNFQANCLCEMADAPAERTRSDLLIPACFTYALAAYLDAVPHAGQVLITDAIAHGPALLRLIRRHLQLHFHLVVRDIGRSAFSADAHAAAQLIYRSCPNVTLHLHHARGPRPAALEAEQAHSDPRCWDLIVDLPSGMYGTGSGHAGTVPGLGVVSLAIHAVQLHPGGRIITSLPVRITTAASKQCAALRGHLTDQMALHELCMLPSAFRFDTCTRPRAACLLVLSALEDLPERLLISRFEPADQADRELFSPFAPLQRTVICATLAYADFLRLPDWNVRALLALAERGRQSQGVSSLPREKLMNLATVERGRVIRPEEYVRDDADPAAHDEDHCFCVIATSCLADGVVDCSRCQIAYLPELYAGPDGLLEDDILIAIRGGSAKAAAFRGWHTSCVASSNLAVIRPKRKALARGLYLLLFLQSPLGMELLRSLSDSRRAGQINIRYKALGSLEIPLPPIAWQDELVRTYQEGLENFTTAAEYFSYALADWQELQERLQQQVQTCTQGAAGRAGQSQAADAGRQLRARQR